MRQAVKRSLAQQFWLPQTVIPKFLLRGITASAAVLVIHVAMAQQAPAPQTPPPAVAPAPANPPAPPAAPVPAPAPPAEADKPAAEASAPVEKLLMPRPVLRLKGTSTWDDGFNMLKNALATLEAEAKKHNLPQAGQPLLHFLDSDDLGFTFEAMLPLGAEPAAGLSFAQGVDATQSPAGRAILFTHESAYDDIDSAYEAITAWLDEKGLVATGKFLEEYLHLPEKRDDVTLKLNIYVFLK